MKRLFVGVTLVALSSVAFGNHDDYVIKTDPYGTSSRGSRDVEMRKKYDYDPSNKYRGTVESDGSVRMRNYNGDQLRGTIEKDGYGRLRDQDGNTYRVKPRY